MLVVPQEMLYLRRTPRLCYHQWGTVVNVLRKSETIEIFAEMPILAARIEKDIFKISVLLKSVKNLCNLRLTQ